MFYCSRVSVERRVSVLSGMVVVIQRVGRVMVSYGERPLKSGAPLLHLLLLGHFHHGPSVRVRYFD